MNKKILIAILAAIIVVGGAYGVYRNMKLDVSTDITPLSSEAEQGGTYSQSGEVTATEPYQIKMSYATFIEVNGVPSSVYKQLALLVSEKTPVFRLIKEGEGYRSVSAGISDIKRGSEIVVYMSLGDKGKELISPIKIDIVE